MSRRLPWSISTTVRNPARLRDFLMVLQRFEGQRFNEQVQVEYQIALIQERLYHPTKIPSDLIEKYQDYEQALDWDEARRIFEQQNYKDPPMRGRQSVNPLNKLGLAVALQREPAVRVTEAGRQLISDESKASDILFSALLKLQYPNPLNTDFSAKRGFNIVPMVAVMRLLEHLHAKGKDGLTREEFCLFIPTWLDVNQLEEQAERIIEFSKLSAQSKGEFILNWIREFYGDEISTEDKRYKNLWDYGDNTMRYFRFTKYFSVTSSSPTSSWRIDIEPTRKREVEMLLQEMDGTPISFSGLSEYLEYLGNPSRPSLPWKQESQLRQVLLHLQNEARLLISRGQIAVEEHHLLTEPSADMTLPDLEKQLDELRDLIRRTSIQLRQSYIRWNKNIIEKLIADLRSIRRKRIEPADLEKLIYELLIAIDDQKAIIPNYPMDDLGNPISHAPGKKADIECFYEQFYMIVEVTLDSGHFQWVREGQPVMRHLRQFEDRFPDCTVFCLFLAPRVHQDTYSQFWFAVRYEYDGHPQKIIPLDFDQFVSVINSILKRIRKYNRFSHSLLKELFERATTGLNYIRGYNEWRNHLQQVVQEWCQEVER